MAHLHCPQWRCPAEELGRHAACPAEI